MRLIVDYRNGMKALTPEKFKIVKSIALDLGVKPKAIQKWKERQAIPPKLYFKLIANSKRKLTMSDFMEDA